MPAHGAGRGGGGAAGSELGTGGEANFRDAQRAANVLGNFYDCVSLRPPSFSSSPHSNQHSCPRSKHALSRCPSLSSSYQMLCPCSALSRTHSPSLSPLSLLRAPPLLFAATLTLSWLAQGLDALCYGKQEVKCPSPEVKHPKFRHPSTN
eukprot:342083-Rhodomonas_salina.3